MDMLMRQREKSLIALILKESGIETAEIDQEFAIPDIEGKLVRLKDPKFENKQLAVKVLLQRVDTVYRDC